MFKKIVSPILMSLVLFSMTACSSTSTAVTQTAVEDASATLDIPVTPNVEVSTETNQAEIAMPVSYPIVDTNQNVCYDEAIVMDCPMGGEAFYGQDAQFTGNTPSYTDNGDGTVTDNVTGLMWQKSVDRNGDGNINAEDKLTYYEAIADVDNFSLAGYTDWRLPTIKEAYSLILFSGQDVSGYTGTTGEGIEPFIDDDYFEFGYGDVEAGERLLEGQMATSSLYVTTTRGEETMFGVNFVDGRIKGYGLETSFGGGPKVFYVMYVRGNENYGINDFEDNKDGTISDNATGLMWSQDDSGADAPDGLNWEEALAYVEAKNVANYLGYSDWRLPNVKELQSILDYSRSPVTTNSAAIDPVFNATPITNEAGETDFAYYWSGTTHTNLTNHPGSAGAYVSFGRAMGYIDNAWTDVHGAGAQRSDPKVGDPAEYPTGFGPQGDAIRIYNMVRMVRGGDVMETPDGDPTASNNQAVVSQVSDPQQPANSQAPQDGQQKPDLAAASVQLGVTEEALMAALGDPNQGPPDFAAAAQALGITEEVLREALGITGRPGQSGPPPAK